MNIIVIIITLYCYLILFKKFCLVTTQCLHRSMLNWRIFGVYTLKFTASKPWTAIRITWPHFSSPCFIRNKKLFSSLESIPSIYCWFGESFLNNPYYKHMSSNIQLRINYFWLLNVTGTNITSGLWSILYPFYGLHSPLNLHCYFESVVYNTDCLEKL